MLPTGCQKLLYRNGYWGAAQALKNVVIETIARLDGTQVTNTKSIRMLSFLTIYADEKAIVEISRTLGVHRGTIYRFVMPETYELLADEMQCENDISPRSSEDRAAAF
jgi:hypothetical protein